MIRSDIVSQNVPKKFSNLIAFEARREGSLMRYPFRTIVISLFKYSWFQNNMFKVWFRFRRYL